MNEEEYWMTVTSSEESCDSDKIDSDIEAELYSTIHHEPATARTSTDLLNAQSPQVIVFLSSNTSPFIKHGYDSNVKEKSIASVSNMNYEISEVIVTKGSSNKNCQRKSDVSGDDSNTSCVSLDVTSTKEYSNNNVNEKSDSSANHLYTSFETPEIVVAKDESNMKAKRHSDLSVKDLCTSSETPEVKDNRNTNGKRKSDVSINGLENINKKSKNSVGCNKSEGIVERISRKKQMTSRKNLEKESKRVSVLNESYVCDTSDSDSILWSDADECDTELQTNVEPEVVALSSDSFSDASYDPFDEICSFRRYSEGSPQPSTSFSSNSKDPWHINSDDLYRSKGRSKSSRYHERAVLKCTNCNLKGHTVKFCSVPKNVKCYVCGGPHTGMGCHNKVCSRCFQRGHDARFCIQRFVDVCQLCNMRGHSVKYCPDLWRRYHLTTNPGNIVIANPVPQDSPMYCLNCGEQGHYGAECRLLRPDRCNFQTWTSVIAYVHPSDTIKRIMEDRRHTALSGVLPDFPTYQHRIPLPPVYPNITNPYPKKNKKKKNKFNANGNSPTTKSAKKKKKRAGSASQTPENIPKTTKSKEFNFPRTPKSARKNVKGKKRFEKGSFMKGLHRRLGLNPNTGLPNNDF